MERKHAHNQEYPRFSQIDEEEFRQREEQWLTYEHLLEMVLEVADLGAWKLSFGSNEVHFSARAKAHFGYPAGVDITYEMLGARIIATKDGRKVLPGEGRIVRDMIKNLQETGEYTAVYQVKWADDSMHWIEVRGKGQYSAGGKPGGIVGVTRDITEQKQEQQQQETSLSMTRHELKTPLTTIKGFAQLLRRQMTKMGLADQVETLTRIEEQVNILTGLINELREKSKAQASEQKPVEIKTLYPEGEEPLAHDELPLSMLENLGFSGDSSYHDDARSDT